MWDFGTRTFRNINSSHTQQVQIALVFTSSDNMNSRSSLSVRLMRYFTPSSTVNQCEDLNDVVGIGDGDQVRWTRIYTGLEYVFMGLDGAVYVNITLSVVQQT